MQNVIPIQDTVLITGDVIATDVRYEDFLAQYEGQHVEWINGAVIKMPTVGPKHNRLTRFCIVLLDDFLDLSGLGGDIFHDPMVMKTSPDLPGRAPDIFILLPHKKQFIRESEVAGPADLVIEIVSPGSQRQDRVDKHREYELGGIPEYWLIDPIREETLFHQLNERGVYDLIAPDRNSIYHSRVLPKFKIDLRIFWQDPLLQGGEVAKLVEAMLKP
jgi:Uma2 family endonuclease